MSKTASILIFLLLASFSICAQQSINTSGGDGTGENGSFSYSIGQVFYSSFEGEDGSVTEGVQQTFEVTEVFINTEVEIPDINCSVFPNPTSDLVQFSIDSENLEGFKYSLYNLEGKLLDQDHILSAITPLQLESYKSSIYMLEITKDGIKLKSFQIIKN